MTTKFHPTSFVIGLGSAVAFMAARQRLRPVLVELAAVGVHLGRLGLALVERQRENAEDLWAEIDDRARQRLKGRRPRSGNGAGDGDGDGAERVSRIFR
jgi:hypothetical protein